MGLLKLVRACGTCPVFFFSLRLDVSYKAKKIGGTGGRGTGGRGATSRTTLNSKG